MALPVRTSAIPVLIAVHTLGRREAIALAIVVLSLAALTALFTFALLPFPPIWVIIPGVIR
jgi:hypothetical protein